MLTKGAIGNLVNRYRAVLRKCHLINVFGSLAVASMLVLGGAGVAGAVAYTDRNETGTTIVKASAGFAKLTGKNTVKDSHFSGFILKPNSGGAMGGVFDNSGDTEITGGSFEENIAAGPTNRNRGGAIYNTGELEATGTHFTSNRSELYRSGYGGGAIASTSGSLTLTDCVFTTNYSGSEAGAVYVQNAKEGDVVFENCTFTGNEAAMRGGAISVQRGAVAVFKGTNTFTDNIAGTSGGAISVVYPQPSDKPLCNIIFDTDSITIFEGNKATSGGAIDILDSFITRDGSKLEFRNNEAARGGAISLSPLSGNTPKLEFNSQVIFENNSASGNGGAIDIPTAGCSVTFNDDVTFTNNSDASGRNDVHNDGSVAINGATVTFDGGISSTKDDEGNFAGTITGSGNATVIFTSDDTKVEAQKTTGVKAVAARALNDILGGDVEAFKRQLEPSNGLEFGGMEAGFVAPQVNADGSKEKNPIMDAALKQASITTFALDRILTNDVRKRLGDIRSDKNQTGVWMRWDGGKLKSDGLTNNFNTIQIGGDTKVGKNCRIGASGSFTHGDGDFAQGNGELEGFSFALYTTWMAENGMFADVVARIGHFSTEMNVEGRSGDMNNRVASLSGEYGWRFNVCNQFFVEPQVELAYTYVSSEDLELGDARYQFDNMDSMTGRAGLVAGWNLPDDRGNVYARASVVQQFMGDTKVTGAVTGGKPVIQEIDGDDTWLEYGIGANIKLTDKTYIWADVERTEGADIEEEWRGTVGLRYSF
ncbi:MAG: autotransporter domain-containing protein [Mailhella sp.]|nr:autotransporter domain-containing protein [Mailhella sp.]